jgi:hypothetical protein
VLVGMREYTKALAAIQDAAEHDDEQKNTSEIQQQMYKINQAMSQERAGETEEQTLQRAMKDPEVAEIMSDPIMRSILEQAQSDPPSIQEHMKNPTIRAKIVSRVSLCWRCLVLTWPCRQNSSTRVSFGHGRAGQSAVSSTINHVLHVAHLRFSISTEAEPT